MKGVGWCKHCHHRNWRVEHEGPTRSTIRCNHCGALSETRSFYRKGLSGGTWNTTKKRRRTCD